MLEKWWKSHCNKADRADRFIKRIFYKNEEVRALLDRAVEQQAGMVSPKRYIGNIAQKRKIELLEEQNEKLLKEMAAVAGRKQQVKKGAWETSFEYD